MSENSLSPDLRALLSDAAALLRFQKELGLAGVDLPPEAFVHRPAPARVERATPRPLPTPQRSAPSPEAGAPPAGEQLALGAPQVRRRSADPAAELAAVRADIGDCRRCKLCQGRTSIVFGVGDPRARVMFVGEGPGRDEDLQGEPFVGPAGQLLDKMTLAMGLRRRDVYIANIVKCRPPKNRDPEPDEVLACEPFLIRQIGIVQPEVIVALGRYAAQSLLRTPRPISRLRGQWSAYEGIPLMPTFHPAYLLRNPDGKKAVWMDLQQVMKRLGLEDPRKR